MNDKEFFTVNEVAALLNIKPVTVYRLVKRGIIPTHRIGRAVRIRRSDLEEYLASVRVLNETAA